MPFQSEKQRRYLWANEPEIARDWTDTYGSRVKKFEGGEIYKGIEQLLGPRNSPLPGGRELSYQFREPQAYYMENKPKYRHDMWSGPSSYYGPIGSTGRMGTNTYNPFIEYDEEVETPGTFEWMEGYEPQGKGEYEYNEDLQRALIAQKQRKLYGHEATEGINQVPNQFKNMYWGPSEGDEAGNYVEEAQQKGFPGIISLLRNLFQGAGKKLGMTQVSPEDRTANEAFMGQQGIYQDPQTGRMIGGDFAGRNAPGTSGWGSANFGEMAQSWMDKYGEMEYKTRKMQLKKARIAKIARDHQRKLQQEREQTIKDYSTWTSPSGRDHPGTGGIGSPQSRRGGAPGTSKGEASWKGAQGGRIGFFKGAQADTRSGQAMSPGTSASGGSRHDGGGGWSPGVGGTQHIPTPTPTPDPKPAKDVWNIKRKYGAGPWMGGPLSPYGQYGMPDLNKLYRLKMNEHLKEQEEETPIYSEFDRIPMDKYKGLGIERNYIPGDLPLNRGPYRGTGLTPDVKEIKTFNTAEELMGLGAAKEGLFGEKLTDQGKVLEDFRRSATKMRAAQQSPTYNQGIQSQLNRMLGMPGLAGDVIDNKDFIQGAIDQGFLADPSDFINQKPFAEGIDLAQGGLANLWPR